MNRPPRIALITDTAWKSGSGAARRGGRPGSRSGPSPGRWMTRTMRAGHGRGRRRVGRSCAPWRRRPGAESGSAIAADVAAGVEVAADDERRRGPGRSRRAWSARSAAASSRATVSARAGRRAGGRRSRRVDRRRRTPLGAASRIGLRLQQVVSRSSRSRSTSRRRERRARRATSASELERRAEARRGHVDARSTSRPSRPRHGASAEPLGGLGELDRVVVLRALGERARPRTVTPPCAARLVGGAARQDERRGRPARRPGRWHDDQPEAVGQAWRSNGGNWYGAGLAVGRAASATTIGSCRAASSARVAPALAGRAGGRPARR